MYSVQINAARPSGYAKILALFVGNYFIYECTRFCGMSDSFFFDGFCSEEAATTAKETLTKELTNRGFVEFSGLKDGFQVAVFRQQPQGRAMSPKAYTDMQYKQPKQSPPTCSIWA